MCIHKDLGDLGDLGDLRCWEIWVKVAKKRIFVEQEFQALELFCTCTTLFEMLVLLGKGPQVNSFFREVSNEFSIGLNPLNPTQQ